MNETRITPISFADVEITGGFWKQQQQINRTATLEAVYDRFQQTGRFQALACEWDGTDAHKPHVFWDSDVAKWIEGAAYLLQKERDAELENRIEALIDKIEANQCADGYFNSFYLAVAPENRFTVRIDHELYCAGHWIEAAIAYRHATGRERFLRLICRFADCIDHVFRVEQSAAFVTPGHQELELALVALYQETEEQRYLALADFFLNMRGNNPKETDSEISLKKNLMYEQSHIPVKQQREAVGHCVRALYMYSAMADFAYAAKDASYLGQLEELFDDITAHKMYVTGGVGSTAIGEAFTIPYDLPNETAYNETCASIAMAMFGWRMGNLVPKSKFADIVELELYNGMLSGVSLDGGKFFYENPLSVTPSLRTRHTATHVPVPHLAPTERKAVFDCSCCPPNILRTVAKIGEWVYGVRGDTVFIHQYMTSRAQCGATEIQVETGYPNDGRIAVSVTGAARIALRIPGWCERFTIDQPYELLDGYAYIQGDKAVLQLELPPVCVEANPRVREDAGRVAVMRGPVVYCAEAIDNGALLDNLVLNPERGFIEEACEICGMIALRTTGKRYREFDGLYRKYSKPEWQETEIRLIPYRAFANRGETEMRVWLRV